ncbi:hypothetical protein [Hephaestia mangrovi]|uniref:hypothetical protein n=1 Tax=Hephaestia mangrovi TaxID=2873268 RepID=UPI001CA74BAA|nr:hypothetical protein [Hephaestia mangrovi]MBY8829434.1 hypothetical protein [Hephaestia mangrovi]
MSVANIANMARTFQAGREAPSRGDHPGAKPTVDQLAERISRVTRIGDDECATAIPVRPLDQAMACVGSQAFGRIFKPAIGVFA